MEQLKSIDLLEQEKELKMIGQCYLNSSYFIKKILREQTLAQNSVNRYNDRIRKEAEKKAQKAELEEKLQQLIKLRELFN